MKVGKFECNKMMFSESMESKIHEHISDSWARDATDRNRRTVSLPRDVRGIRKYFLGLMLCVWSERE